MTNNELRQSTIKYQDREAVATFDDEAALHAAVDALMQFGVRQEDMSVLGEVSKLSILPSTGKLADRQALRARATPLRTRGSKGSPLSQAFRHLSEAS